MTVLAAQARAESRMFDTCRISRPGGTETTDPNTGKVTRAGTTIYEGKCRVQSQLASEDADAGDFQYPTLRPVLQIPMSVTGVRTGDTAVILTSIDPDLVGVRLRVDVPMHKTEASARRLPCTEGGTSA